MFANHDRRARRRANSPTLATLEDRRLMTAGLAHAAVAGDVGAAATPRDAHGDAASAKAWIAMGSDAQFGPAARVLLSDGHGRSDQARPSGTSADASSSQTPLDAALLKQSTDFQAARDGSQVTPQLLDALRSARDQAASEAKTPDAAAVQTLQGDVESVWRSGTFTDVQRDQLKADFVAALRGAGVSDATVANLLAAQDAVASAGNVSADELQTLAADQAAVQTQLDAMPAGDASSRLGRSPRGAKGDAWADSNRFAPNLGTGSAPIARKPPSFHGMRTSPRGPRP